MGKLHLLSCLLLIDTNAGILSESILSNKVVVLQGVLSTPNLFLQNSYFQASPAAWLPAAVALRNFARGAKLSPAQIN